jgi:hypothetical protein
MKIKDWLKKHGDDHYLQIESYYKIVVIDKSSGKKFRANKKNRLKFDIEKLEIDQIQINLININDKHNLN